MTRSDRRRERIRRLILRVAHAIVAAVSSIKSALRRPRESLFQGIYRTDSDRRRHLQSIRKMQPDENQSYEHGYLYGCLSILDTKSQGVLAYDAILIAATTVTLATLPSTLTIGTVLIFMSLTISAVSSVAALYVIWVYWTDTVDFEQSEALFLSLLEVRNRRTLAYRSSWMLSHSATLLLVLGILLQRRL